jgi:hypothetical protein
MLDVITLQTASDVTQILQTPWEKITIVGILLGGIFGLVWYFRKYDDKKSKESEKKDEEIKRLNGIINTTINERLDDIKDFYLAESKRQEQLKELTHSISMMLEVFRNNLKNGNIK